MRSKFKRYNSRTSSEMVGFFTVEMEMVGFFKFEIKIVGFFTFKMGIAMFTYVQLSTYYTHTQFAYPVPIS